MMIFKCIVSEIYLNFLKIKRLVGLRLTKIVMILKFIISLICFNFLRNKESGLVEANQNYDDIQNYCK